MERRQVLLLLLFSLQRVFCVTRREECYQQCVDDEEDNFNACMAEASKFENGRPHLNEFLSSIRFTCNPGYTMTAGSMYVKCDRKTGSLVDKLPTCSRQGEVPRGQQTPAFLEATTPTYYYIRNVTTPSSYKYPTLTETTPTPYTNVQTISPPTAHYSNNITKMTSYEPSQSQKSMQQNCDIIYISLGVTTVVLFLGLVTSVIYIVVLRGKLAKALTSQVVHCSQHPDTSAPTNRHTVVKNNTIPDYNYITPNVPTSPRPKHKVLNVHQAPKRTNVPESLQYDDAIAGRFDEYSYITEYESTNVHNQSPSRNMGNVWNANKSQPEYLDVLP